MEFNPYSTLTPGAKLEENFNVYKQCPTCKGLGEIKKNEIMLDHPDYIDYYKLQGRLEQLHLDKTTMNSNKYWEEVHSLNTKISILEIKLGLSKHKE